MQNNSFIKSALRSMALLLLGAPSLVFAQQDTTYVYEYDAMGNLTRITDPLLRVTDQEYDPLNRLKLQHQPTVNGSRPVIQFDYDYLDQITSVTDPRNLVTSYTVDGLGNQAVLTSPDTGAIQKTYDSAGNLKTSTDAKGQTTVYQYDALNRIVSITYHDGNVVNYTYDIGQYGIGRLSGISDVNSTIQYSYNQAGKIVADTRTTNGVTYTTAYEYDVAGHLSSITYPSGRVLNYQYDALGRIVQIDTIKDGVTQTLISQATYHPFGGIKSFVNGANQTITRGMDLDGRTTSYTLGAQAYSVSYDAASRIELISDLINPSNIQIFGYDDLNRLTSYNGTGASQAFTYDSAGNRTSKQAGSINTSYTYSPNSSHLTRLTNAMIANYQLDSNGSITNNFWNQFAYDARGRLISAATVLGPVHYKINALGQRIAKTISDVTTVFHYDLSGKLVAESTAAGEAQKEYVYLYDLPVALLQ